MREGWEIKKLGEVCEIIGGSTPKTNVSSYWDGEYYWITPAELNGSKYVSSTIRTITAAGIKSAHLQLLPIGTVLLSSRAPIGKVAITTIPMYCNQGFKNLVCGDSLYNEYVYWFLSHNTEYLNSLGAGATFKEISKRIVEQILIPVPPLSEQKRIVAELDLLSEVIAKKREQLTQLDALAQSLFYTMFGDPITNEKGWETKSIDKICVSKKEIKRASSVFSKDDRIIYIDISSIDNVNNIIMSPTIYNFGEAPSRAQQVVQKGDILISLVRPNLNNVSLITTANPNLVASSGFCVLRATNEINTQYLFFFVKMDHCREYLMQRVAGANYPAIKTEDIMRYKISLPPLALQQQFAEKIEAIEQQKERIRQSLAEVQLLFDSRMDYYFNEWAE